MLTYIKGGTPAQILLERGSAMTGCICYFLTEVSKFYWLMLLLYPCELYRLLGTSSFFTMQLRLTILGSHIDHRGLMSAKHMSSDHDLNFLELH